MMKTLHHKEIDSLLSTLSDLDYSSIDKLLNLIHHHGVLHVLLGCLGIFLEVYQHLQNSPSNITTQKINHLGLPISGIDECTKKYDT